MEAEDLSGFCSGQFRTDDRKQQQEVKYVYLFVPTEHLHEENRSEQNLSK